MVDFGREALDWIISNLAYPAIVLGLFSGVAALVLGFVLRDTDREQQVRRLTAAVIPVLVLVFALVTRTEGAWSLDELFAGLRPLHTFGIGAAVGLLLFEIAEPVNDFETPLVKDLGSFQSLAAPG